MKISMILNGKKTEAEIDADMLLIDFCLLYTSDAADE